MNKYQEALDTIQSYYNALEMLCEHEHTDFKIAIKTLQELVDQTKTPTLEQVKKEWEDLGYELIRRERRFISYQNKLGEFIVMTWYSEFKYEKHWNGRSKSINLKEHNLIYKTMKLFEIELGG